MRWPLVLLVACASAPRPVVHAANALVDAGAEPREPIRLHFAEHATHRTRTTWMMTNMPPLVTTIDEAVDSVAPDGTAKIRLTTVDVDVPATADKKVRDALEPYRSQAFVATMTPRGAVVDRAKVTGPDPGEDWLSRFGFPEAAIGVGAKWDDSATVDLSGTKMTVVGHRTLKSRDGDTIVVDTRFEGGGKSEQGIELTVAGSGETTYHLAAPLGTTGHGALDMTIRAGGGNGQTLHLQTETTSPP